MLTHKAVPSALIGVRSVEQLQENFGALDIKFTAEQLKKLATVSAIGAQFAAQLHRPELQHRAALPGPGCCGGSRA